MEQNHLHVIIYHTLLHYSACVLDVHLGNGYKGLTICFGAFYKFTSLLSLGCSGKNSHVISRQSNLVFRSKLKQKSIE